MRLFVGCRLKLYVVRQGLVALEKRKKAAFHIFKNILFVILFSYSIIGSASEQIVLLGLLKNGVVIEVTGKQQVLRIGESTSTGIKLLSVSKGKAIFDINGQQKAYQLDQHISTKFKESKAREKVVIAPTRHGMYITKGSINGIRVEFIIDTGATLISMNRHIAKRLGIDYKEKGDISQAVTASGLDSVYIVNLNKVRIGDIVVKSVSAAVHDGDFPDKILLGNSFLNRINIYRKGRLLELEEEY